MGTSQLQNYSGIFTKPIIIVYNDKKRLRKQSLFVVFLSNETESSNVFADYSRVSEYFRAIGSGALVSTVFPDDALRYHGNISLYFYR